MPKDKVSSGYQPESIALFQGSILIDPFLFIINKTFLLHFETISLKSFTRIDIKYFNLKYFRKFMLDTAKYFNLKYFSTFISSSFYSPTHPHLKCNKNVSQLLVVLRKLLFLSSPCCVLLKLCIFFN